MERDQGRGNGKGSREGRKEEVERIHKEGGLFEFC